MLYPLIGRAQEIIRRLRHRPPFLITLLTFCGFTTTGRAATADDYAGYRYEDYREDNGRIHVRTHTIASQVELTPWLTAKGKYVYDGISGATPTGAPPPAGSDKVPTAVINDIRRAYSLELPMKFGAHGIAPSFSWSRESDYESIGAAATYSVELNQKNTTLLLGVSRDFDRVIPNRGTYIFASQDKSKQDVLLGVIQLLDPETVLTANLTFSYVDGYLADPYKGVNFFINYLDPSFNPSPLGLKAEKRPDERFDQIANVSLSRFFKPLNASMEAVYRFYHNDYGIFSHTASLTWFQKIGSSVVVSPMFRFYNQTAADFYTVRVVGDPAFPNGFDFDAFFANLGINIPPIGKAPPHPALYSADYRLSQMNTYTLGVGLTWRIKDRVSLDAAYKRYMQQGLDSATSNRAYADANVWTLGLRVWF